MRQFFFASIFFTPLFLFSQYQETIASDRPGQTFSANTVGKYGIQIQSGIEHNHYNSIFDQNPINFDSRISKIGVIYYDLRIGLSEKVDFGIFNAHSLWNRREVNVPSNNQFFAVASRYESFKSTSLNLRINFLDEGKNWLNWGVMIHSTIPEELEDILFGFRTMLSKSTGKHCIASNLEWYFNDDIDHVYAYTLSYSYNIFERFGVYIENYGRRTKSQGNLAYQLSNVDGGIYWYLNSDVQMDFMIGYEKYYDEVGILYYNSTGSSNFTANTTDTRLYIGLGLSARLKSN